MKTKLAILALLVVPFTPAQANTIAQWTFDTSTATPTSTDPSATSTAFTLSSGSPTFVAGNPSAGKAIRGTGWNVSDGVKYWGFTVTPDTGYLVDLSLLKFDDQRSDTGPTGWKVTVNGVTAILGEATHGGFETSPMNTVDLSAADFQGLGVADVRIFGFGASGGSGAWRLDNVILEGTALKLGSVPETEATIALLLASLIGLLFVSFRDCISRPA